MPTPKKQTAKKGTKKTSAKKAYQAPAMKKMQKLSQVTGMPVKLSGHTPS